MSAQSYLAAVEAGLATIRREQLPQLKAAGRLLADAITADQAIYAFGSGHSFILPMELCYRTGGLMLINPIYPYGMDLSVRPLPMTSQVERLPGYGRILLEHTPAVAGDVLILASTSGRNAVVIDMALAAQERGLRTIAVTSLAYSAGVPSRHASGKKLLDLCQIVIDNGAPLGDAAVAVPGVAQKTGPLSTVLGAAVVNAMVAEAIAILAARGTEIPVFLSANMPGGDEHNARMMKRNAHRIHYL